MAKSDEHPAEVTITVSGVAKSGKTTIATLIANALLEKGVRFSLTDELEYNEDVKGDGHKRKVEKLAQLPYFVVRIRTVTER